MSDANHVVSCGQFQVIYKLGFINCESNTIFVRINSFVKWYEILMTYVLSQRELDCDITHFQVNNSKRRKKYGSLTQLVDLVIGLMKSVLNLVKFWGNSNYGITVISTHQIFWVNFGLVYISYSYCLPEWQAVKLSFLAPFNYVIIILCC